MGKTLMRKDVDIEERREAIRKARIDCIKMNGDSEKYKESILWSKYSRWLTITECCDLSKEY